MKKFSLKFTALFFVVFMSVCAMAQTVALQEPVKEPADAYPQNGNYQLVNQWIRSASAGNYRPADIGGSNLVRGMVTKDGMMYFCHRGGVGTHSIIVVDGETGAHESTVMLSANAWAAESVKAETGETEIVSSVTLPNNDIKLDSEGNFLVGPCIISGNQPMQVYKVDIETGECTELINEVLADNPDFADLSIRFDAFGVWGDVEDYAVVMAMNAHAMNCFRWVIEDGVAGAAELVTLDPLYVGDASVNPGNASQIMPISEDLFYVDGNATFPTLYQYADGKGARVDCFYDEEGTALSILGTMNAGHNGLTNFQLTNAEGETEYFMCCAATNTVKDPESSFAIIKYADEAMSFQTAELLYQFPKYGFGQASNAYRAAPVSVEVIDNVAYIYCYVGENGFAHYTFSCDGKEINQNTKIRVNLNCNKSHGSVSGAGKYSKGSEITIAATPNEGYHFVRWSDGNTNATRTFTVNSDISLTAEFAINIYDVTLTAENGTVIGSAKYNYGTEATIMVIPNEGCLFSSWSDGNTDNPRKIIITQDITLNAICIKKTYNITLTAENGTFIGAGEYNHGSEATITAIPNEGYHFVRWSDGNTNATRKITVTSNISLTAEFEINTYTVTLYAENGSITGEGVYNYNTEVTITATPAEGYHFMHWSDGNTNATRTITVTSNVTLTAEFEINTYSVTLSAENGTTFGAGEYTHGTDIIFAVVAHEGYKFSNWSDDNTDNPRNITVTENINLEAILNIDSPVIEQHNNFIVESINESQGSVTIFIIAEGITGFEFSHWSDGNTENPRTVTLDDDVELYAYFMPLTAVDIETSKITSANVYTNNGLLYVEGTNSKYHVLDAAGRLIYTGKQSTLTLPRGIYFVTIAGEVQKIVL